MTTALSATLTPLAQIRLLHVRCCGSWTAVDEPRGSPTRSNAVRLDRAVILRAAQEICDRDGLSALTLRRLGNELGVDATAMYRHFRDKAELISALIDDLFRLEVDEPDPQGHWRDNLRKLMIQWWQIYRRHEGLAAAMAGQPDDEPQLFDLTEWTVRELIRAGVDEGELGLYHQTIYNHTVGNGLVAALSPWLTDTELRDEQRRHYAALDPVAFRRRPALPRRSTRTPPRSSSSVWKSCSTPSRNAASSLPGNVIEARRVCA